jgi:hypothetical protein
MDDRLTALSPRHMTAIGHFDGIYSTARSFRYSHCLGNRDIQSRPLGFDGLQYAFAGHRSLVVAFPFSPNAGRELSLARLRWHCRKKDEWRRVPRKTCCLSTKPFPVHRPNETGNSRQERNREQSLDKMLGRIRAGRKGQSNNCHLPASKVHRRRILFVYALHAGVWNAEYDGCQKRIECNHG